MNWTSYEAFAGIGAWGKALERVVARHGDSHELIGYWEFDKYASNAFAAIHNVLEDKNYWDIMKELYDLITADIFFYNPPCQTYSIAGKQEGATVDKGNLFWNALQKIKVIKPKFAIMENVGNLAQQFKDDFKNMLMDLEAAGYVNYNKVLNSKDYGIPQNRERIFIVSIRKDLYDAGWRFEWPNEIKLELRLKDMLEAKVQSKYFLTEKQIATFTAHTEKQIAKGNGFKFELTDGDGVACAITCRSGQRTDDNFIKVKSATVGGHETAYPGDSINLEHPNSTTRRGRVGSGVAQTLTTSCNQEFYNGYAIRKLTPLECFRLQGFDDEDYHKAVAAYDTKWKAGASDSQMYKRAGNSITVNVIEEILENLLYQRKQEGNQLTLF